MPYLPKSKKRPWLPEPVRREHQGRTERSPLYNTARWQRTRKAQLAAYPLCVECEQKGIVTAAKVADHIERYNTVKGELDFFGLGRGSIQCLFLFATVFTRITMFGYKY